MDAPRSVPPREDRSREEVSARSGAERAEGSASASAMRRGAARGVRHIESLRHAAEALSRAPTLGWVCCCRIEFPYPRAPRSGPCVCFRAREAKIAQKTYDCARGRQ